MSSHEIILRELQAIKAEIDQLESLAKRIRLNRSSRLTEMIRRVPTLIREDGRTSFAKWMKNNEPDPRYQPICQIEQACSRMYSDLQAKIDVLETWQAACEQKVCLFLGTIDFDFLFQRPQHFAVRLAKKGYLVYYIDASFGGYNRQIQGVHVRSAPDRIAPDIQSCQDEKSQCLVCEWLEQLVDEIVWLTGGANLIVMNQHPLWQGAAEVVRQKYQSPIVADYMDDYLDFPGTPAAVKPYVHRLLQNSDVVLVTSEYLEKKAYQSGAKRIEIIRNGTDCQHFYSASCYTKAPEQKLTVGYYGVLSTWFDCKIIEAISASDLDVEICLVGTVTPQVAKDFEKLQNLPKVRILDAVPYEQLPAILQQFDVCLIPFDANNDLIKATNPVKFYEYLSAGKKVVATEIPELMPYNELYLYCENEDNAFVERVRQCLNGTDTLAKSDEVIGFAQKNDWDERVNQFVNLIKCLKPLN